MALELTNQQTKNAEKPQVRENVMLARKSQFSKPDSSHPDFNMTFCNASKQSRFEKDRRKPGNPQKSMNVLQCYREAGEKSVS